MKARVNNWTLYIVRNVIKHLLGTLLLIQFLFSSKRGQMCQNKLGRCGNLTTIVNTIATTVTT